MFPHRISGIQFKILPQNFPVTFTLTWNPPCQHWSFSEQPKRAPLTKAICFAVSYWCQMKKPDWLSGLGYEKKPLAIYHIKCNGGFLSSFWHNHGYFPCLIYHGKVWSHAPCQFPAVKGSFTTVKASCVTAPYILGNNVCQYSGYKKKSSVTDINYICITPL